MAIDASTLPVSPVFVIAAAGYAAACALITGPEVASREISRSNWQATCETALVADLEATRRPEQVIPQVPDIGGMLCGIYPELNDLCAMIPDPNVAARDAERRAREAEDRRIARATARSINACTCAEQVYIETERLSLALYTGTARLVTPPSVENREAALMRALRSPVCQQEG